MLLEVDKITNKKERLLKWRDEENKKCTIKHIELDFSELLDEDVY